MWDLSTSWEHYHGQWDKSGDWLADPAGSDLNQYRLTGAFAYRLAERWQMAMALPYVVNNNRYDGPDANSAGLGDATLAFKYESFDDPQCVYEVSTMADLIPAIYWGLNVTLPTGLSPYDDVGDTEITGRGFYRLDGSVLFDKTIYPWTASLSLNYGTYLQRPVNRDYGNYVEPYDKQLGDRSSYAVAMGYVHITENISEITTTLSYSDLREAKGWDSSGGLSSATEFTRRTLSLTVAWSDITKSWVAKTTWTHTPSEDGWGENFAATDVLSIGVSHVYW